MKVLADLTGDRSKKDWRWMFLDVLGATACVSSACRACRVSRKTAYNHRNRFPRFASKWDEALVISIELLELEARRRAFAGPSDNQSAGLLKFLLQAHRPEKYREGRMTIGLEIKMLGEIVLEAESANDSYQAEQPPEDRT